MLKIVLKVHILPFHHDPPACYSMPQQDKRHTSCSLNGHCSETIPRALAPLPSTHVAAHSHL